MTKIKCPHCKTDTDRDKEPDESSAGEFVVCAHCGKDYHIETYACTAYGTHVISGDEYREQDRLEEERCRRKFEEEERIEKLAIKKLEKQGYTVEEMPSMDLSNWEVMPGTTPDWGNLFQPSPTHTVTKDGEKQDVNLSKFAGGLDD